MDTVTKQSLKQFANKALQRLEDKKITKYRTLYIPSIDESIVVRSLTKAEVNECLTMEGVYETDIYTAYIGVHEPDLRTLASELKQKGEIREYTDVVDIFTMPERSAIVKHILELSEVTSEKTVKVVETAKNS